jgi:hypothetical protein
MISKGNIYIKIASAVTENSLSSSSAFGFDIFFPTELELMITG